MDLHGQRSLCRHLGHARQGWKCRLCKINVHADCRHNVGRCLPKSRLLRRQKSSSELEAANYDGQSLPCPADADEPPPDGEEIDQTYVVLKQASELAAARERRPPALPLVLPPGDQQPAGPVRVSSQQRRSNPNALSVGEPASFLASSSGKSIGPAPRRFAALEVSPRPRLDGRLARSSSHERPSAGPRWCAEHADHNLVRLLVCCRCLVTPRCGPIERRRRVRRP